MKKTKIVIPALGLLLLSTAASVTGTVAWFSANATVTASALTIKASVDANLFIENGIVPAIDSVTHTSATLDGDGVTSTKVSPVDFDQTSGLIARIPATYSTAPDVANAGSAATWTTVATLSSGTSGAVTGASKSPSGTYVPKDYFVYGYVTIARKQTTASTFNLSATATVTYSVESQLNKAFRVGVLIDSGTMVESADNAAVSGSVALMSGVTVASGLDDNEVHVALLLGWFEGQDTDCYTNNAVALSTNTIEWQFTAVDA